jgi:hypothetical protein
MVPVTAIELPRVNVEGVTPMDMLVVFAPVIIGAYKKKERALITQIILHTRSLLNAITFRLVTPYPLFH